MTVSQSPFNEAIQLLEATLFELKQARIEAELIAADLKTVRAQRDELAAEIHVLDAEINKRDQIITELKAELRDH